MALVNPHLRQLIISISFFFILFYFCSKLFLAATLCVISHVQSIFRIYFFFFEFSFSPHFKNNFYFLNLLIAFIKLYHVFIFTFYYKFFQKAFILFYITSLKFNAILDLIMKVFYNLYVRCFLFG
jgi:hypothetical protein